MFEENKMLKKCYCLLFSVTHLKNHRLYNISKNESIIKLKSFIMKKTIIISAVALCFSIATVSASPLKNSTEKYSTVSVLKFKVSPFCVSIAKGDFETVKKLIELGTDINQKSNGMTPAMYAARYNRTEILKLLISKGVDLKEKSHQGITALKYAELSNANEAAEIIKEALSK